MVLSPANLFNDCAVIHLSLLSDRPGNSPGESFSPMRRPCFHCGWRSASLHNTS
ncbi:hypothetical protein BN135_3762 [Cronobacter muytjensii 530]